MTLQEIYKDQKRLALRGIWSMVAISSLTTLLLLAVPLFLFQVYDRVLFSRSIETLLSLGAIVLIMLFTYGVLDAIRSTMFGRIAAGFEARLAGPIIAAELSRASDPDKNTLAHLVAIRQFLASPVLPALIDLPVMLVFLAIVFFLHPLLGWVVLLGMLGIIVITVVGELLTRGATKEAIVSSQTANRKLSTAFALHETVRSMGIYREIVNDWAADEGRHFGVSMLANERSNIISAITKTARQVLQIVLIGTGAWLVLGNLTSAGIIFAASMIGGRALQPVEVVVGGWRTIRSAQFAQQTLENRIRRLSLPDQTTPLPRPRGQLSFDSLVYVPPSADASPILRGVTGSITAGGVVAIIGPSGAGKSTLARCIVGYLAPSRGRVTLDGQDLDAWDPVARGRYVGYMPQSVEFFEGTVQQNIARMRKEDPPGMAVEAAQFVGVHEMILSFPDGYDTLISASGFQPSGGQKQLLALARAFYGRPSVVVLDEPNASLDGDGEALLVRAIRSARQLGITVVIVTQRMSVVRDTDRVLVLKDGRVDRFVEPDEVIRANTVQRLGKASARGTIAVGGQANAPQVDE